MTNHTEQELRELNHSLKELAQQLHEMQITFAVRGRMILELEEAVDRLEVQANNTETKLDKLLEKITKWEAKLGGILFVGTCVWAFVVAMKEQIMALFKVG